MDYLQHHKSQHCGFPAPLEHKVKYLCDQCPAVSEIFDFETKWFMNGPLYVVISSFLLKFPTFLLYLVKNKLACEQSSIKKLLHGWLLSGKHYFLTSKKFLANERLLITIYENDLSWVTTWFICQNFSPEFSQSSLWKVICLVKRIEQPNSK